MSLGPKVTVYIPSKNYSQFLEQAVRSVFLQTFQDWRLILIDDGSSDSSFEIMNRFSMDTRVSVHQLTGLGLPAVANFALNMAESEYFVRLDGDDYMNVHALEVLTSVMDQNPDLDFVFPDYYEVDDEGRLLALQTRSFAKSDAIMSRTVSTAISLLWTEDQIKEKGEKMLAAITKVL